MTFIFRCCMLYPTLDIYEVKYMAKYTRMKVRNFSIHDDLWERAIEKAQSLPISVSIAAVIRALLKKWVEGEIEL